LRDVYNSRGKAMYDKHDYDIAIALNLSHKFEQFPVVREGV